MGRKNRYSQIIEAVFFKHYEQGVEEVSFDRSDIVEAANDLGITLPKNLGDIVYSFRYRAELPGRILSVAPEGHEWLIRPSGRGEYTFQLSTAARILPSPMMAQTKVPDATPGIIDRYALDDEQALLARLRYNRLIDIFTGLTCYSLQSHVRTMVPDMGQVETDEIYVGIDKRGAHHVLPVEAKSAADRIGIVQIEQDFAVCAAKFSSLIARPVAAQFMPDNVIAMFEFERTTSEIAVSNERHYTLVPPEDLTREELENYRKRGL